MQHLADLTFFFFLNKLKACGYPALNCSVRAIFPHCMCLLYHILVILTIFQTISFYYNFMVLTDFWCYYCSFFLGGRQTAPIKDEKHQKMFMRFKERKCLHNLKLQVEATSADVGTAACFKKILLRSLIKMATLNNRFSL